MEDGVFIGRNLIEGGSLYRTGDRSFLPFIMKKYGENPVTHDTSHLIFTNRTKTYWPLTDPVKDEPMEAISNYPCLHKEIESKFYSEHRLLYWQNKNIYI
jgi:hypothetical protein